MLKKLFKDLALAISERDIFAILKALGLIATYLGENELPASPDGVARAPFEGSAIEYVNQVASAPEPKGAASGLFDGISGDWFKGLLKKLLAELLSGGMFG